MSTMEQEYNRRTAGEVRIPGNSSTRRTPVRNGNSSASGRVRPAQERAERNERTERKERTERAEKKDSRPRNGAGGNDYRKADRAQRGGGGGNRPPRKSRKDMLKDRMILLLEILFGLLLLSVVALGASKIFTVLGSLSGAGIGKATFAEIKSKVSIVVILEIVGIIALFAGMISGRIARLKQKLRLSKKQRNIMLIMEGIGLAIIVITGIAAYVMFSDLRIGNVDLKEVVQNAGYICYVLTVAFVPITAAPVFGEIIYLKKDRETQGKRKVITLLVKVLGAVLIVAGVGYTAHTVSSSMETVQKLFGEIYNILDNDDITNVQTNLSQEDMEKMSGYINIAVFGVDSRADKEENDEAGTVVDTGSHNDVTMIVSINCDTKEVKLLSVYRDTCMLIQKKRSNGELKDVYEKLTHSYAYGSITTIEGLNGKKTNRGPEFALNALNRNLDLNITEYVTVNFDIVAQAIDALGGLDIEITSRELRHVNRSIREQNKIYGTHVDQLDEPGLQHLNGVQATSYARVRKSDSDYVRTERQRKVVQLMLEKAKTLGIGKVMEVVKVIAPQVRTNINSERFNTLAMDMLNYSIVDQKGFPFEPYWDSRKGVTFAGGKAGSGVTFLDEVTQMHEFLFGQNDYTPSSKLQEISNDIEEIRNGGGYSSNYSSSSSRDDDDDANNEPEESVEPIVSETPKPSQTIQQEVPVVNKPTPTPVPTVKPTVQPTPTPTPEPTIEPTPMPTPEPTPSPEPEQEPQQSEEAVVTPVPTQEPEQEVPVDGDTETGDNEDDPGL